VVKEEESYGGSTVSGAEILNKNMFYEYDYSFGDDLHIESWIQCRNLSNSAISEKVCLFELQNIRT
jgi:hypothetical protein